MALREALQPLVTSDVRLAGPEESAGVARVLEESFGAYPVMRFVLGDGPGYDLRITRLMRYYVELRALKAEPIFACGPLGAPTGVALIARPGATVPEVAALQAELWEDLGSDAEARYAAFGASVAPFKVSRPHLYLSMLGALDSARGTGVGRVLLDAVHQRSASDSGSEGVALTTEVESNVALYQHFGYTLLGQGEFGDGRPTWGFFREDDAHFPSGAR
ncbi:MAG: GNAT family N-acetyltransferase [Gemmatimonadota bacterium]